jgi:hypothetical protein
MHFSVLAFLAVQALVSAVPVEQDYPAVLPIFPGPYNADTIICKPSLPSTNIPAISPPNDDNLPSISTLVSRGDEKAIPHRFLIEYQKVATHSPIVLDT